MHMGHQQENFTSRHACKLPSQLAVHGTILLQYRVWIGKGGQSETKVDKMLPKIATCLFYNPDKADTCTL